MGAQYAEGAATVGVDEVNNPIPRVSGWSRLRVRRTCLLVSVVLGTGCVGPAGGAARNRPAWEET